MITVVHASRCHNPEEWKAFYDRQLSQVPAQLPFYLLLFFRPFIAPGSTPARETDIALLWATKVQTAHELATISNTLKDVRGFIATKRSMGVRIHKDSLASVRQVLISRLPT